MLQNLIGSSFVFPTPSLKRAQWLLSFGRQRKGTITRKHPPPPRAHNSRGGGNNKRERKPDNIKEEKRKRRNTTSANVNSNKPNCNHCGWWNYATSELSLTTHKIANHDAGKPCKNSEAGKAALQRKQNRLILSKKGEPTEILNILSNTSIIC